MSHGLFIKKVFYGSKGMCSERQRCPRGHNSSFYHYRVRVYRDGARKELVLDRRYMTAAEIGSELQLSRGTVHRLSNGKTRRPRKWAHVEVLKERAPRFAVVERSADIAQLSTG